MKSIKRISESLGLLSPMLILILASALYVTPVPDDERMNKNIDIRIENVHLNTPIELMMQNF